MADMVHGPRGARTDDGILYTAEVPVRGHGLSVAVTTAESASVRPTHLLAIGGLNY